MSPVQSLEDALKRALRAGGVTYADVARDLGLSEASVKRMFSRGAFTLERFEAVCRMVDLGITDLVRLQEEGEHRIFSAPGTPGMATVGENIDLTPDRIGEMADESVVYPHVFILPSLSDGDLTGLV